MVVSLPVQMLRWVYGQQLSISETLLITGHRCHSSFSLPTARRTSWEHPNLDLLIRWCDSRATFFVYSFSRVVSVAAMLGGAHRKGKQAVPVLRARAQCKYHENSESILLILWLLKSITRTRCRHDVVEQVRPSVTACCGKRVQEDFAAWSCAPYQETKTLDIKENRLIDVDVRRSQGRQVAEVPTKAISFCIALRNQLRKARTGHVVGVAEAVQ